MFLMILTDMFDQVQWLKERKGLPSGGIVMKIQYMMQLKASQHHLNKMAHILHFKFLIYIYIYIYIYI